MPADVSNLIATRRHQIFPVLSEAEIARIGRFGSVGRFGSTSQPGTAQ